MTLSDNERTVLETLTDAPILVTTESAGRQAELLGLTRDQYGALLIRLEKRGLIEREHVQNEAYQVSITPSGRSELEKPPESTREVVTSPPANTSWRLLIIAALIVLALLAVIAWALS